VGVYAVANACLRLPTQEFNMKFTSRMGVALSTLAVLGAFASIATAQVMTSDGVLVGPNKMTLYTFDKDVAGSGKSMCNGPCASNWPPLMAAATDKASGDFSVISRDDGKKQWAVKGKPLYYWSKDSKPGDKTGDGINEVWHTATP
jgi:predicted lipoprotein with Yx(FWY)xxD motif